MLVAFGLLIAVVGGSLSGAVILDGHASSPGVSQLGRIVDGVGVVPADPVCAWII